MKINKYHEVIYIYFYTTLQCSYLLKCKILLCSLELYHYQIIIKKWLLLFSDNIFLQIKN